MDIFAKKKLLEEIKREVEDLHPLLGMVFKTPVKPEWRERCAAGTMAS